MTNTRQFSLMFTDTDREILRRIRNELFVSLQLSSFTLCESEVYQHGIQLLTRMHLSRMRTVRLLAVRVRVSGGGDRS